MLYLESEAAYTKGAPSNYQTIFGMTFYRLIVVR